MTTGVVLMTYGAPSGRSDLPGYLTRVRGGREPSEELVTEFTRRYERIGWSPLVRITAAQAEALEAELGSGWRVAAGMRYSEPTIARAVQDLRARGADRLIGVVLSPQWSDTIMAGYEHALEEAAGHASVRIVHEWHGEPAFVDALAERIREALAQAEDPDRVPLVLTAHSLPRRVFDAEPAYIAQLKETAASVAARAGLAPERWRWAYQSAGHTAEDWLRPDLKELFPDLAAQGHREVLVVPVQFLADHLEVLYDLDVAAAEEARLAGLRYRRIEMPNTRPTFIRALAAVVRRAADLADAHLAVGR